MRLIGGRPVLAFSDRKSSGSSNESSFIHAFVDTPTNSVPFAETDLGSVTAAICSPTSSVH